jgi:hypothetical protein
MTLTSGQLNDKITEIKADLETIRADRPHLARFLRPTFTISLEDPDMIEFTLGYTVSKRGRFSIHELEYARTRQRFSDEILFAAELAHRQLEDQYVEEVILKNRNNAPETTYHDMQVYLSPSVPKGMVLMNPKDYTEKVRSGELKYTGVACAKSLT